MNYGVTYCPYPDGKPELEGSMFITAHVWGINKRSNNTLEENWSFLSYLTSKDIMEQFSAGYNGSGILMARQSVLNNLPASVHPLKKKVAQMLQSDKCTGFPMSLYVNDYLVEIDQQLNSVSYTHLSLVQSIQNLMEELISQKEYRTTAVTAWINIIFVEILRYSKQKDILPSFDPLSDRKIEKISPAILHITRHYHEPIQISDLAALCNLSVTAFRRNFIAVMDIAPHEYLNRVRANMGAILLIKSTLPVADIAYEVGCSSISTFNRIFKGFYHTTPVAYRISQRPVSYTHLW